MHLTLTLREVIQLNNAHIALDGYNKSVNVNGQTQVVRHPYKLGKKRGKISDNLARLEPGIRLWEKIQKQIRDEKTDDTDSVPPENTKALRMELESALDTTTEVDGLQPITRDELELDKNEIPVDAEQILRKYFPVAPVAAPAATEPPDNED